MPLPKLPSLLLIATSLITPSKADCTRSMLQSAADTYISAQASGHYQTITPLSPNLTYTQNNKSTPIENGILSEALSIAHNRSTLDTTQCATYTELIITDPKLPSVIGTQMRFSSSGSSIVKIETIVTHKGDWLFNASNTLRYASSESWPLIPPSNRDSRATIQAAADAYLDDFLHGNASVPWGTPCARLEGGMYLNGSCNVGVPTGVPMTGRRYVIDEEFGAVDVMLMLAGDGGMPDSHEFRVESGKLRFVHTMSVNLTKSS